MQFGQHPGPRYVLAHVSDTHFLGGDRLYRDSIDTDANLRQAMDRLERTAMGLSAIVFTGDIADLGEVDAYHRVRSIVEPATARMACRAIWVMGNHDDRGRFRSGLLSEDPGDPEIPVDGAFRIGGLRVIALDSTVPGYHHGELTDTQLEWLAAELATPAPDGTLLALHHPPVPTTLALMAVVELRDQHRLEEVLRGTDVRSILGGHLHYSTTSTLAGIPVSVAAATCYTMDPGVRVGDLVGRDGAQAINLVHVYDDRVVHTVVPLAESRTIVHYPREAIEDVPEDQRLERFGRHQPRGE